MKKFLIVIAAVMMSLCGFTQVNPSGVILGSIQKNADPAKADIVLKPSFNNVPGEYVYYLQIAVSLPDAVAGGLTASATSLNNTSNLGVGIPIAPFTETFLTPSTSDDERVFGFVLTNSAVPGTLPSWTNGTSFVGAQVTFNAPIPGNIKMLDLSTGLGGGGNSNTFFSIVTAQAGGGGGDCTNYPALFFSIPGLSITGNYPAAQGGDQYVESTSCTGAVGGTASGSAAFCLSGTPAISANGYSAGFGSSYQWMSSTLLANYPNGGTPVGGQTNPASLTTGVVTNTTYYWLRVFCTSGLAVDNSTLVTVTINPLPAVICPTVAPVCINTAPFPLVGGAPAGGTYSGPGVMPGGMFNPALAGPGPAIITYCYADPLTGCTACCTFTILVNPLPVVTCPQNMTVCTSTLPFPLGGGNPPGGVYSGPGVAGGIFNAAAAGPGTHPITYCFTDPVTGCSNCCQFTITVTPPPAVNCPANMTVCVTGSAFPLVGGTPAGGTYSGTGVAGGIFNPAAAVLGTNSITYCFTDPSTGCSACCTFTITVTPLPTVTCPSNMTVCFNAPPFPLGGGLPAGGTYSGLGVTGNMFDPGVGTDPTIITYTYSDPLTGCGGSCTFTISVKAQPTAVLTSGGSTHCGIQTELLSMNLVGAAPITVTWSDGFIQSGLSSGANTRSVSPASTTTYTITNVADAFCSNTGSGSFTVTVNPLPNVSCPSDIQVCITTASFTLTGGSPAGGTYSGSGVIGGTSFSPSLAGGGTHAITYTYSDPSTGCNNSCQFTIDVQTPSTVTCPSDMTVCIVDAPFALTGGLPASGTYSGAGVSGGNFDPASAGAGTHTITYTYGAIGCTGSCTFAITVLPSVSAGTVSGLEPLCIGQVTTFISSGTSGGTWSSSNPAVATVNPLTGAVTATGVGATNITYTLSSGCGSPTSSFKSVTVNPDANAGTVSGATPLCTGATANYSSNGDADGTWASSNPAVATVNATSGKVTALSAGTTNIIYTVTKGCNNPKSAFQMLTVTPNAGSISGVTPLCQGSTAQFTTTGNPGGTWSSNDPGVATVNPATGEVTAVAAGNAIISYSVSNGCPSTATSSFALTVIPPNVTAGTVSGKSPLCISRTALYTSDGTIDGVWSSSNPGVATVNPVTGLVTTISAGTTDITYTITSGCGSPTSSSQNLEVLLVCVEKIIRGSITTNVDPSKIDVKFRPLYSNASGEYILYLQLALSLPDALAGGMTASATGTGTFANMLLLTPIAPYTETFGTASTADDERVFGFQFSDPTPSAQSWTNGTEFDGVQVMFSSSVDGMEVRMLDLTSLNGGDNSNSYYVIVSSTGDLTDNSALFYAIPGSSQLGNYPSADQYVRIITCTGAVGGTASGSATFCPPGGGSTTITASGYSTGSGSAYQWYSSTVLADYPNGGTAVPGETNPASLTTGMVTTTTYYWLRVTCNTGTSTANSTLVTVTVAPQVTAIAGPNGMITPAGTTTYNFGDKPMYTITPATCYKILDVQVDGVSEPLAILSGSYTFSPLAICHTITATFVLDGPFDILATSGSDGTIAPLGITSVPCGGSQTYQITPDPGFVIGTVLINGVNNPGAVTSGTYTFTNVQGPQTIHATFVTACVPTTVTISASSSNNFCGNLVLTANPATPGAYTYEWKRGAIVVGTSQTLTLTTASPDGVYCVTAATSPSCVSAPACYTYSKQGILQSYTILGIGKEVELGENNTVLNGSVGNTKLDGEIHIKKNAWIAGPGQFVKGRKIKVDNPSNVPVRIFAPAMVTLPAMMYNTTSTSGLPDLTVSSNITVTGNYKNVTVKKNKVVTFTGSIFGKMNIEEGAQVTFTSTMVNFMELFVKDGGSTTPTRVKFTNDCTVKVKVRVAVGKRCQINPTGKNVVFYVDMADFEVKSQNTWVIASIYNPKHRIYVHDDGGKPGYMIGRFIANYIDGHAKFVTWNNYDCAMPPPPPPVAAVNPGETDNTVVAKMEVTAYPNPSSASFSLKLKTEASGDVIIRVHSISGKLMQEVKGTPDQIFRVGDGLVPGIYIAELTQGDEKVMVKLVKQ